MMVSIIIPVYRVEKKYFDECMASVLGQTYEDIEVLLVDDGALPELAQACDEYANADNRVRVFHQENKGAAAARNLGLDNAKGDYITFVDSDDYISKDNIQKAYDRITSDNLQVLLWGSYKCYGERHEKYMPYTADVKEFSELEKRDLMLKTMVGYLPFYKEPASHFGSGSCCSKMYRRSFLNDNNLRYPEGIKRAEDVNFNIRVFDRAEHIGYLNEHFYYYRQLSDSATYTYRQGGIQVFTDALGALESFLKETKKDELFWQVYYMRCVFFFLESMDMDYLNPMNKAPLRERLGQMREAVEKKPYSEAVKKLDFKYMSMARRIPVLLMKYKCMGLLCLFYSVYRRLGK